MVWVNGEGSGEEGIIFTLDFLHIIHHIQKLFFIHYRGEFVKQKCPVSTCVLTSDRKQQNTADLILFKVLNKFFKSIL